MRLFARSPALRGIRPVTRASLEKANQEAKEKAEGKTCPRCEEREAKDSRVFHRLKGRH